MGEGEVVGGAVSWVGAEKVDTIDTHHPFAHVQFSPSSSSGGYEGSMRDMIRMQRDIVVHK